MTGRIWQQLPLPAGERKRKRDERGGRLALSRTLPAVEALSTGPAQAVAPTSATLTGSLTPKGSESYYYFQWGTSSYYGKTSPAPPGIDAGAGKKAVAAATDLSGLSPNTTYHYRLVGNDSFGTTTGEDAHFTTSGPPRVST